MILNKHANCYGVRTIGGAITVKKALETIYFRW